MLDIRLQEVAGYLEMEMVLVPNEGEDEKAVMNTKLSVTKFNTIDYVLGLYKDQIEIYLDYHYICSLRRSNFRCH